MTPLGGQRGLGLLGDRLERRRLVDGEIRQHLAVDRDARLGQAVEKKCEGDFLARLKPPQKMAYQREMKVCDRKYRNQSGSMYVSFTAFCRAIVAQRYSHNAHKMAGSSPSR